jgi:hypothetical protein
MGKAMAEQRASGAWWCGRNGAGMAGPGFGSENALRANSCKAGHRSIPNYEKYFNKKILRNG